MIGFDTEYGLPLWIYRIDRALVPVINEMPQVMIAEGEGLFRRPGHRYTAWIESAVQAAEEFRSQVSHESIAIAVKIMPR